MKLHEVAPLLEDFRDNAPHDLARTPEDRFSDTTALVEHGGAMFIALLTEPNPVIANLTAFQLGFYFREWLEVQKDSEIDFVELHRLYNKETT